MHKLLLTAAAAVLAAALAVPASAQTLEKTSHALAMLSSSGPLRSLRFASTVRPTR